MNLVTCSRSKWISSLVQQNADVFDPNGNELSVYVTALKKEWKKIEFFRKAGASQEQLEVVTELSQELAFTEAVLSSQETYGFND